MNPNSALIWFPKILAAGLPAPQTWMIPYSHSACLSIFDGDESPEFDRVVSEVRRVCSNGRSVLRPRLGYPAFLRTDLGSAKHGGPKAYKISSHGDAPRALANTLEDQEMKFWLEREGPAAVMVREFLELDAPFAAFSGLPIAREWRFFASESGAFCAHPYWPESAIQFYGGEAPEGWREKLAALHERPAEWSELERMAIEAARVCGGSWSVDFARDKTGKWWLLDMALMEASWHWPGCSYGAIPQLAAPAESSTSTKASSQSKKDSEGLTSNVEGERSAIDGAGSVG